MLKDVKQITELYLHSTGKLPEDKSWNDFHDNLVQTANKDAIGLLADAKPKDKCKYALFVNVDTKSKTCKVKDYVEINAIPNWPDHLFWQYSGARKSESIRNTPHKIYGSKSEFSIEKSREPLSTILNDYCKIQDGKGKKKTEIKTGPLFWDKNKIDETKWLENIISILNHNKGEMDKQVKEKFPPLKQGEQVFVGLIIDGKPIGEYELFRRYLLFVRIRAGIQEGPKKFKNKGVSDVIKELNGLCPSCHREIPLLDQWWGSAELSFYQMTNESLTSYAYQTSSFRLCQSCTDLLFVFKQRLLEEMTTPVGGNQCLVLPSIKLIPSDHNAKKKLYDNLKSLWDSSNRNIQTTEKRLLYRLGQLPSYATVSFIFGDYITVGESQDVKRLDRINVVFPDVLPSRLSQIANAIQETNTYLNNMWSLTGRDWNCTWNVGDDFRLLQNLFHPSWDEDKKNKDKNRKRYRSLRRPETERYLRAIFYGYEVSFREIAEDCYSNLLSAFKTSRTGNNDSEKYALTNYIGDILSLIVFFNELGNLMLTKEVGNMTDYTKFEFIAMPDLGKFVEMHPLFKDVQYLAPFFVGCLFSYAENLQKDNSRLAAYNWLGTMALTYEDILQDIYPKVLNYITNKEKIVSSPRLQELTRAVAYYDKGKCESDRVALVSFCHGWAVGRDFIYKKKEKIEQTTQEGGINNG
jgi:hypothetical protein